MVEIELQDKDGHTIDVFEISDSTFHALEKIAKEHGMSIEDTIHRAIMEKVKELLDNEQNKA